MSCNAIFSEDELPEGQEVFIELNAELSQNGRTSHKLVSNLLTVKSGMVKLINYNILKNNFSNLKKTSIDWSFYTPSTHFIAIYPDFLRKSGLK